MDADAADVPASRSAEMGPVRPASVEAVETVAVRDIDADRRLAGTGVDDVPDPTRRRRMAPIVALLK